MNLRSHVQASRPASSLAMHASDRSIGMRTHDRIATATGPMQALGVAAFVQ